MSHAASRARTRADVPGRPRIPRQRAADPPGERQGSGLRRVRRAGYAVLGLKLVAFCYWSSILYRHFALTSDFAQYQQAWYLIGHGHLDPYDTVSGFAFWQNHGEFIMWPLAVLGRVWPNGLGLLWIQDAGVTGAELVAFLLACDLVQRYKPGRDGRWLAAAGLVLLAADPWSWWAVSFDFHTECVAVLFIALLARDLLNGRRRAWLWVVPLVACGDVAGTYMFGLGAGVAVACRGMRRRGAVLAAAGVGAVFLVSVIHANKGSGHGFQAYQYLAAPGGMAAPITLPDLVSGLAAHPAAVAETLWSKRLDIWANLAASGLVGLAFIPLLPLIVVVIVSNDLFRGFMFSQPLFQTLPAYVLLPVATAAVLAWLTARRRRTGMVVTALIVAQAIGWAIVWAPRIPAQFQRVPASTAAVLAGLLRQIPPAAAVFASQGVVGRFSSRLDVHPLQRTLRLDPRDDWFILTPRAGIETQNVADAAAFAGVLAGPLHARLVTDRDGVMAFRWTPPAGMRTLQVPGRQELPVPGWTAPGAAGHAVLAGTPGRWHVTSGDQKGYVFDQAEWLEPPGQYTARVTLSARVPVNVEVWNDTGNVLLARRQIPPTAGTQTVTMDADASRDYQSAVYQGWGPFRARLGSGPAGQRLEIRVWTPGGGTVNVYDALLKAQP